MTGIVGSVGRGGVNNVADVRVVQGLLNPKLPQLRLSPLKVDGSCGPLLITAIERYQRFILGMTPTPGRVDPKSRTLASLAPLTAASIGPAFATAPNGRPLTQGEIRMLQSVFNNHIKYDRVEIYSRPYSRFLTQTRAMAPDGSIYYPEIDYRPDFSSGSVGLLDKAKFIHEATHLYQHYELHWNLLFWGPLDRNYAYVIEPGKTFPSYGLEQMGSIAQDFFVLRSGGSIRRKDGLASYTPLLPVR